LAIIGVFLFGPSLMTAYINLSHNELWALLTRTFEALYGHERDYYDMARTVLWLECHGHAGVEQLIDALPILEKENLSEPDLTELPSGRIALDGAGHSLLCIGRSVADLAMAYAEENGMAQVDITNVSDSKSLIGNLTYIASQDFSALALCKDKVARMMVESELPTLYTNEGNETVSLICSKNDEVLQDYLEDKTSIMDSIEHQHAAYEAGLEQGLNVKCSHYDTLTVVANRVLVEATEASRRGAGE